MLFVGSVHLGVFVLAQNSSLHIVKALKGLILCPSQTAYQLVAGGKGSPVAEAAGLSCLFFFHLSACTCVYREPVML